MMDCHDVRDRILESFDHTPAPDLRAALEQHLAGCSGCSSFARAQKMLDDRLALMLVPPAVSPAFRSLLRERIAQEPASSRLDSLLEWVHFASFGVATLVLATILPVNPATVIGVGTAITLATYVLMSAVRGSFEDELLETDA
jgi:predicted anti-sigma-YlaC factor YlaD